MDTIRFDTIGTFFARRRLARQKGAVQAGASLVARASLVSAPGAAQEATPDSPASAERAATLFVQSFASGTIAPKEGAGGTYTLTLEHGWGQTIYVSDRPERIVGAAPTPQFLEGLGFSRNNPPNAALVVDRDRGGVEMAVVELFNPAYDDATHTATYDVAVLEDDAGEVGLRFQEAPGALTALSPAFGAAHLFIDDCPDASISCHRNEDQRYLGEAGVGGLCWSWSSWSCEWCDATSADHICNITFAECDNYCHAVAIPYD